MWCMFSLTRFCQFTYTHTIRCRNIRLVEVCWCWSLLLTFATTVSHSLVPRSCLLPFVAVGCSFQLLFDAGEAFGAAGIGKNAVHILSYTILSIYIHSHYYQVSTHQIGCSLPMLVSSVTCLLATTTVSHPLVPAYYRLLLSNARFSCCLMQERHSAQQG